MISPLVERSWQAGPVGSEEARFRAGLRPPLKLHVRFSRMQLSRRLSDARMQEKVLSRATGQARTRRTTWSPAAVSSVAPTSVPMRPDSPPDPTVETLEEFSDLGAFVCIVPRIRGSTVPSRSKWISLLVWAGAGFVGPLIGR